MEAEDPQVFGLRVRYLKTMSWVRNMLRWSIPVVVLTTAAVAQTVSVSVSQPGFDFGQVLRGAIVEHAFTIVNTSKWPARIKSIRLSPPLLPTTVPKQIPAGGQAEIRVKLDTTALGGAYEGVVRLSFDDSKIADVELTVTGRVLLPLQVDPPAVVVTAQRGAKAQGSVEIINHGPDPVVIERPVYLPNRFTARLDTVEEGRRFRLTVVMDPNGPSGKNKEMILLKTSSATVPELRIAAFTYLHERVYTFPDVVELGVLRLEDIRRDPDLVKRAAQTLMVYRKGTSDFQAKFSTDTTGLTISAERGPLGDRYQLTVSISPDKLEPGIIRGSIFIETNDAEFPKLTVPVIGQIRS